MVHHLSVHQSHLSELVYMTSSALSLFEVSNLRAKPSSFPWKSQARIHPHVIAGFTSRKRRYRSSELTGFLAPAPHTTKSANFAAHLIRIILTITMEEWGKESVSAQRR